MKNIKNINWELAARVYSGEASKQEMETFDIWLQDPQNKLEWEDLLNGLGKVDHALLAEKVDVEHAWQNVKENTFKSNNGVVKWLRTGYIAAAASVIIAIVIYLAPNSSSKKDYLISYTQNSIEQLNLKDGSVIDLNRNSTIEYPNKFTSKERNVLLKGEAFFNVTADEKRPFIVNTSKIQIRVLGTSFNVRAFPNSNFNEVNVNSGIVEVIDLADLNNKVVLKAGDKAIFDSKNNSLVKMVLDDVNYMAWRTKEFSFKNDSLAQAINLIEEVYQISVIIPHGFEVSNYMLSATFDDISIDHIMSVLNGIYGVEFHYKKIRN